MSIEQNILTPIYVQCNNICIDKRFAIKNSGISCLALIFNLSNPRMTFLLANKLVLATSRLQDMTNQILFFFSGRSIQIHGLA